MIHIYTIVWYSCGLYLNDNILNSVWHSSFYIHRSYPKTNFVARRLISCRPYECLGWKYEKHNERHEKNTFHQAHVWRVSVTIVTFFLLLFFFFSYYLIISNSISSLFLLFITFILDRHFSIKSLFFSFNIFHYISYHRFFYLIIEKCF